ncbi:MAG: SpoIIIAC/SpoIIIAD family protein [Evtepia sp.]
MDMIQVGAVALTACLCAVVIKQKNPEIGLALALATCVLLLMQTMPKLAELLGMLHMLAEKAKISETILRPVIQTVGLAIVTRLAAELCRDAKEAGIAAFVETAGAVASAMVAIPLLKMVLELIAGLL